MVIARNGPTEGKKTFVAGFVGNTREILEDARETGRFLILHLVNFAARIHQPFRYYSHFQSATNYLLSMA